MKTFLLIATAICGLALTGVSCALLLTVRAAVAGVPGEIAVTRSMLVHQVEALRIDGLAEIDRQATEIRQLADRQATEIRQLADRQATAMRQDAGNQIAALRGDTLSRVDTLTIKLEAVANKADAQLTGLRDQISPVLANTAALIKDAQDSWDDSYNDVRGLLQSSTVAATQIAQTAESVRQTAPEMIATAQETNRQFAGIATDVHKATTAFTAPLTWKQKIWQGFKSIALVASHF